MCVTMADSVRVRVVCRGAYLAGSISSIAKSRRVFTGMAERVWNTNSLRPGLIAGTRIVGADYDY